MEIKVGEYILRSDSYCMWIDKEYEQKNGKTATKRVAGYATSYEQLRDSFLKHRYLDNNATTVKEMLEVFTQTAEDLKALDEAALKHDFKIIRQMGKKSKGKK